MSTALYNWFLITSASEFLASGLVQKQVLMYLSGIGQSEFIISKGNLLNVQYLDTIISVGAGAPKNPHARNGYAAYIDDAGNLYWGFPA